jgi:hypothetical protein
MIIDKCLSRNEKIFWDFVIKLSQNQKKFGKKELSITGIDPEFVKIMNLSEIARNNVTFHYHGTTKHLKTGFELAFKNSKQSNTQYAYVTEIENVTEDRRYYIDIALQKFLEEKAGISKDIFAAESLMIEFMADFNNIVYKILCEFNNTLGFEDITKIKD